MPDGSPWPRVSITTPSYNQGRYLEETIRSVLLQGYPHLEYVIFDGGSTDNSVEIIRRYEPWVTYWVSERDGGQGDAINKGFERSTGELVAWVNSDDYLYPGFVARRAMEFQERPEAELIYGDVETAWDTDERRALRAGRAASVAEMLRTLKIPIPQQSCMWRRSALEKIGPLRPEWRVTLDREYLMRTCFRCRFEYVPGAVALFRYHGGSIAMSEQRKWLSEIPRLYREIFEQEGLPADLRSLRNESMSSAFLYCARVALKCGERGRSALFAFRAIATYPRLLLGKNEIYWAVWKRIRRCFA